MFLNSMNDGSPKFGLAEVFRSLANEDFEATKQVEP
jgi:hypothetical protein